MPGQHTLRHRIREGVAAAAFPVEEWWCRHVTQRRLYRHFDAFRRAGASAELPDNLVWLAQALELLEQAEQQRRGKPAP